MITEFLKIDFPCLPLNTDRELFHKLCAASANLVRLHLLEAVDAPADWKLHQDGAVMFQNTTVASGFPKKELAEVDENGNGRVYINKSTYFDGVPNSVFEFHIGGYQVSATNGSKTAKTANFQKKTSTITAKSPLRFVKQFA